MRTAPPCRERPGTEEAPKEEGKAESQTQTRLSWKGTGSPGLHGKLGLRGAAGATFRPSREPRGRRGGRPGSGGFAGSSWAGVRGQGPPTPGAQVWPRQAEWVLEA